MYKCSQLFFFACILFLNTNCGSDASGPNGNKLADASPDSDLPDSGVGNVDAGSNTSTCDICESPPTSCHANLGNCQEGVCEYEFVTNASCDDQNPCTLSDQCASEECAGVPILCEDPPNNVCLNSTTLRSFDIGGACSGGLCVYNSTDVSCGVGGCENGSCSEDICESLSCDTPPNLCFAAAGVCENDSCSYPYNDNAGCDDGNSCTVNDSCETGVCQGSPLSCNLPPANVCENSDTLRAYSSVGSCNLGTCGYTSNLLTCSGGCENGVCQGGDWTVINSGVTVKLRTVWGSSETSVWAGGDNGTLVYYNGNTWQVRPSGTGGQIRHLHGTAEDNIFAQVGFSVRHFDGTSWSATTALGVQNRTLYSMFAIGPKEALLWERIPSNGSTRIVLAHLQFIGGSWQHTDIHEGNYGTSFAYPKKIWANSVNSVYLPGGHYWDGSTMTTLSPSTPNSQSPGMMWQSGSLLLGLNNDNLYEYNSNESSWIPMASGFAGSFTDLQGVDGNRVFMIGGLDGVGHVLYFDGVGWTDETVPGQNPVFRAVWPLVTGEVFVVGDNGTILKRS